MRDVGAVPAAAKYREALRGATSGAGSATTCANCKYGPRRPDRRTARYAGKEEVPTRRGRGCFIRGHGGRGAQTCGSAKAKQLEEDPQRVATALLAAAKNAALAASGRRDTKRAMRVTTSYGIRSRRSTH